MCANDATRALRRTRGSTITPGTRSAAIMTRAALRLRSRSRHLRRLTWGCRLVEVARLLSRRRSCRRGRRSRSRRNLSRPINNRHINRRHNHSRRNHSRRNHNTLTEQPPEPLTDRVCPVLQQHHQAHKPRRADLGTDLPGQLNLPPGRGRQRQAHQARRRPHPTLMHTLQRISSIT